MSYNSLSKEETETLIKFGKEAKQILKNFAGSINKHIDKSLTTLKNLDKD